MLHVTVIVLIIPIYQYICTLVSLASSLDVLGEFGSRELRCLRLRRPVKAEGPYWAQYLEDHGT